MPTASVNGLDLAYDVAGEGDPVLMINGIGADRTAWGLQVPEISKHFTTITFDNRDVGETRYTGEPQAYQLRQFADDAAGLLDILGLPSAHIVGASMGGAIAQEFAIAYPKRTRSVTIACSWPKSDSWMIELMSQWDAIFEQQGRVAWSRNSWLWVFTHRFYQQPGAVEDLVRSTETATNPQSLESYLRQSAAFKGHDAHDRLGEIASPAHIICGEEDIYTPLRYSIEMANAISEATLSVMPEVGHGMFWEATDEFNRLVVEFIRESRARGE
jgi:pimeloyl-ACP methyl ester carboxylesterase